MEPGNIQSPPDHERPIQTLEQAVFLNPSKEDRMGWHWVVENLILFRWQRFKNFPRGNTLVLRAFLIVLTVSTVLVVGAGASIALYHAGYLKVIGELLSPALVTVWGFLFCVCIARAYWMSCLNRLQNHPSAPPPQGKTFGVWRTILYFCGFSLLFTFVAAGIKAISCLGPSLFCDQVKLALSDHHLGSVFVAAVAGLYWQMSILFNRQWQHCNDLYTDYLKSFGDRCLNDRLANALAYDLLVCDMWANRSFEKLFRRELTKAIEHVENNTEERKRILQTLDKGGMSEDEASRCLSEYEDLLLGCSKTSALLPDRASTPRVVGR